VNSEDLQLNFRDNDGANAVHWGNYQIKFYQFLINSFKIIASEAGNEEMVEVLIEKNVDINIKDKMGWTPLMRGI
jgi:ankyrin repeat protein